MLLFLLKCWTMLVITEQNETPQQPLFHHTLCCIKFSDINFDSWVRVKLFFLTSHHCSKHCHTQCISRAVLILSWICPLSLSSAIWLEWYTKHRAGVLHRGCWTTTAARKCKLQTSHPGPPHRRLLSDHAQLSCTKPTPIFNGLSKPFSLLLLQRSQWTYSPTTRFVI